MRRTIGASEGSSIYLLGLAAGSVLSLILSLAFRRVSVVADGMSLYNWLGYAVMQIAFIAVVLVYARARKIDLPYVARIKRPVDLRQLILTPFIAIAAILIFLPLANLWNAFLGVIGFSGAVVSPAYSSVGYYFLALLLMAILPAVGEELIMRGCLFSGLSTRNVWFGISMSALLFSLMHQNPLQTVHQFGLGVVLALVVALTDSVLCAMLVHFFNNFISITCAAFIPEIDVIIADLGYFNFLTGAASVIAGLILLAVLLFILFKLGDRGYRIVSGGIEYDEFTIYAPAKDSESGVKQFFAFFKSLFTKSGWRTVTRTLENRNGVQYVGKAQNMLGVWIALGLTVVYWLIAFISGLL